MANIQKVGPKGQIVISKEIREKLGVKPGSLALEFLVDGHLEVRFLPPPHRRSLKGALARYVTPENRVTLENWGKVRERAWANAAAERTHGAR